jgi:phosphatidylinositol-3,4,5-trisphosphate 3-phosphatase/dual-specificity protein phosphatase PTEN
MHPLTDRKWDEFRDNLGHTATRESLAPGEANLPLSEANSMYDVTQSAKERGVVLDAGREVRVKLYMGQV